MILRVAERVVRSALIGYAAGSVWLRYKGPSWLDRIARRDPKARDLSAIHQKNADQIYRTATRLRGLLIKMCQVIGTRSDVFPPAYVKTLSQAHDRLPPREFEEIRCVVEEDLGKPLDAVFAGFEREPLASASLAQVHPAVLRSGERVAVKVQYPEIESLVRSDLSNLRLLFRALGLLERDFDLMPLIDELGTQVPFELDFVHEGHNSEKISQFYADRDDIYVPRVHGEYTTRRVLVMEFIDGVKISDVTRLRAAGLDPDAIMRTLIGAYCEQILTHGFFHADPHPGNLIVQPGGAPDGRARLVFVDFGLAKELPSGFQQGILELTRALLQGSPERMAEALHDLGFETRTGGVEALHEIAKVVLETAVRLRQQSWVDRDVAAEAAQELPRMIRENPIVRVPSHVVLLGRVVGLLSGIGRSLEARIDMLQTILPYVLKSAQKG